MTEKRTFFMKLGDFYGKLTFMAIPRQFHKTEFSTILMLCE